MNRVFIALLVMAVWYSASASEPVDTTIDGCREQLWLLAARRY